jgi:hypothetical protein
MGSGLESIHRYHPRRIHSRNTHSRFALFAPMKHDKRTDRIANIVIGGSLGLIAIIIVGLLTSLLPLGVLLPLTIATKSKSGLALIATLVSAFVCAHWAGKFAQRRGRSRTPWLWLGAIFGPFAVLAAYLLPAPGPARKGKKAGK